MLADREVLVQRLEQSQPGQLGKICQCMAEAGVNIEVLYSDHENRLILVVDDVERGKRVSAGWARERGEEGASMDNDLEAMTRDDLIAEVKKLRQGNISGGSRRERRSPLVLKENCAAVIFGSEV